MHRLAVKLPQKGTSHHGLQLEDITSIWGYYNPISNAIITIRNYFFFFCLRSFWWPENRAQEMELSWSMDSHSELGQFASWWGPNLCLDFQVQCHDNHPLLRTHAGYQHMGEDRNEERKDEGSVSDDASTSRWYEGPWVNSSRWWLHDFQTPWAGCSCLGLIRSFPLKTQPSGASGALLTACCFAPALQKE